MRPKKQVVTATMRDVTLRANISMATVSRVLVNPDKISQATRNRAEQTTLEVGYLPQSLGRNMKRNESRTILVIIPDICDPSLSEVTRGIEVTAIEHGYLVLIGDYAHQNQKEKTFIDLIITKQVDSMVLLSSRLPFGTNVEEQHNLPPMVMPNEFAPELELPTAHIDNLTVIFNAANCFRELGHRHIDCIAGPKDMPLCRYRLQGYVQVLRRSSITIDPYYIVRGNPTFKVSTNALEQLLSQSMPPTAVSCHNDMMALGALPLAKRRDLKVPNDLSVAGLDSIMLSEFYDPPLTTVSQPRLDIDCEGMLLLLEQIRGHNVNSGSRLLNCELIVRGNTQKIRR